MSDALVQIRSLEKTYTRGSGRDAQAVHVLQGLSLQVHKGDFVALMGPSGSGKTTLLNLIAGIDRPTAGELMVDGLDITRLSESELARWRASSVGFIFQLYNLIPVLTAAENVELPLLLTKLGKRERREHVQTALSVVGLADRMGHYPRQLSGGQEQRVAIARAIVTDPLLLLADEPTGDLDKASGEEILELLSRLNREFGKTILMVTHDPHAAERAKRLVRLEKGVLVSDDVKAPASR
ncbi:MAG: ABC transporter ATP-binding protein [Planctomycetes bacterium]|nr:ABC transporter ATP-binding protein [Planctomycetota bacterium]